MTVHTSAVLDDLGVVAAVVDRHGAVTAWTGGFRELTGRSQVELQGRPLWEFVSPADQECLRREVIATGNDRQSRQVDVVMAAPARRRVVWTCSFVSGAGNDSIVALGNDIGEAAASTDGRGGSRLCGGLASRELELSAIYENIPGILFYVAVEPDSQFRFLSMSRAGAVATGLPREQFAGALAQDVIPPSSSDLVLNHYREAIRSGRTVRWKEVSEYPAGLKVGEVAVTPIYDASGVATHLIGIVHDVTERERLEEALRQREERLRLALEASRAGTWTRDAASSHVDWDERFRRLYGFSRDEPASFEGWLLRVHEEDRSKVLVLLDEALHPTTDEWDITFRIVRPDGTVAWIQSLGRVERDTTGEIRRLAGIELDVTARLQTEKALQKRHDEEHNRELRLLLDTAAQGIVSVDAHGTILMVNRAIESMFGWQSGELIGQSIERLVPRSLRDGHARHRTGYVAAPFPGLMAGDLVGARKDGSTFPIDVSLNHVATGGGGRAIAFVTDITERQRTLETLQDRTVELEQRSAQLSRLASDLTLADQRAREQLAKTLHDGLQQLLVSAVLRVEQQIKKESREGTPAALLVQAKDQLDEAIAAARSLSVELAPPLLQYAGLPSALMWLADWSSRKYGLEVQVNADPLADSPRKDVRTLLFESVRELLFNVVKHAQVDRVAVDLTFHQDDMLCITVTDQGVGLDVGALFERTKTSQVGVGLLSIRERVTLLGGRFDIESAPGQGTRFRLLVPRDPAQHVVGAPDSWNPRAGEPGSPRGVTRAETHTLRILIVDDHAGMRTTFRGALDERLELRVVGDAANGIEAIAQARTLRPDVILMDISMPLMNGVEATRRIHAELPGIQILGLSIEPRTGQLHAIEQAGATGFFTKGPDMQPLIDHLLVIRRAIAVGPREGEREP